MRKTQVILYEALCESVSILMDTGMEYYDAVLLVGETYNLTDEQCDRFTDALYTRGIPANHF